MAAIANGGGGGILWSFDHTKYGFLEMSAGFTLSFPSPPLLPQTRSHQHSFMPQHPKSFMYVIID